VSLLLWCKQKIAAWLRSSLVQDVSQVEYGVDRGQTISMAYIPPQEPKIEWKATYIRALRAEGMGILKIGRALGVGASVVQRELEATAAS